MAVKELGMVYMSQVANEAVDYVTDQYPQGYMGAKYVDLGLGAVGALAAMGKLPKMKPSMTTAIEIVGLGRLAKATMDVIKGQTTPSVAMRPMAMGRQGVRITSPARVAVAGSGQLAPAGI